jgi:arylsulfatase A-like enzyme
MLRTCGMAVLIMLGGVGLRAAERPNIVLIYADDLGFGDLSSYGATAVSTPQVDRLAREGLRFTDAHSPAATCTPSRYAMLTGEYAFRQRGTGILAGDAPLIIQPGRATLASLLRDAGYRTAVVGKWHLGLGNGDLDWNGPIRPGPLEVGFDACYLIPATGDRVPTVYVEDDRVVGLDPADPLRVSFKEPLTELPTGKDRPDLLRVHPSHGHNQTIVNGISRIGYMSGGRSAYWDDEAMADHITEKAVDMIQRHVQHDPQQPFFLFFSLHDIHVPRTLQARFAGKSGMGPRGDVILQADDCVGKILSTLDRLQLADNTLVIFTSDNGPVVDDGYQDEAVEQLGTHRPAGPLRGGKYSAFEGGTRVPLLVRWPARISPGTSSALVSQIDFLASFAALVGSRDLPSTAPDTQNVLPALLGENAQGREELVEQAAVLALRQGPWKYIEPGQGPKLLANTGIESGQHPQGQLFNLDRDLAEQHNVAPSDPERLAAMRQRLREIRGTSR